jgi:hypothetical protein
LYLGFVVTTDTGQNIRPLINASDPQAVEIFLQDVMGMSRRSYNRRLLALTLQTGRPRPDVHSDLDSVLEKIGNDRLAIAFAWQDDIQDLDTVKVLRILWQR